MSEPIELILPSSTADLAKIKSAMQECSGAMLRVEGERTYIKEAIKELSDEYNIPKKILNKLLRTYHKNNKDQVIAETEQFEAAYEAVFESVKAA